MSSEDLSHPPGVTGAGETPAGDRPAPPPPGSNGFFESVRRIGLTRSDERWVGGVAGGVADRFGLDPLLVRGLLILSFFLTGAGLVLYGIGWALLPERRDGRIHLQDALAGRFDIALLGAVVTLVVGFSWGDGMWSWWNGALDWLAVIFWIAIWGAVIWLVVRMVRSRRRRPVTAPGTASGTATSETWQPPAPSGYSTATTPDAPVEGSAPAPFTPAPPASYISTPVAGPATSTDSGPEPLPGAEARWNTTPPSGAAPAAGTFAPPRPRRRGPGTGTVGVVLGLVLLTGALLLVADRVGDLGVPFWPTWVAAAFIIVGAGIVVSGLRGRRGGGLTWLAVLGAIAALVVWPSQGRGWDTWDEWRDGDPGAVGGSARLISEGTLTPRTIQEAESGAQVRFGEPTIDLTQLDLSDVTPGEPVTVPIGMTAGTVTVVIPRDEAVEADVRMAAGNVRWELDGERRAVNGFSSDHFASPEVSDEGGSRLLLQIDGRVGEIVIEEEA